MNELQKRGTQMVIGIGDTALEAKQFCLPCIQDGPLTVKYVIPVEKGIWGIFSYTSLVFVRYLQDRGKKFFYQLGVIPLTDFPVHPPEVHGREKTLYYLTNGGSLMEIPYSVPLSTFGLQGNTDFSKIIDGSVLEKMEKPILDCYLLEDEGHYFFIFITPKIIFKTDRNCSVIIARCVVDHPIIASGFERRNRRMYLKDCLNTVYLYDYNFNLLYQQKQRTYIGCIYRRMETIPLGEQDESCKTVLFSWGQFKKLERQVWTETSDDIAVDIETIKISGHIRDITRYQKKVAVSFMDNTLTIFDCEGNISAAYSPVSPIAAVLEINPPTGIGADGKIIDIGLSVKKASGNDAKTGTIFATDDIIRLRTNKKSITAKRSEPFMSSLESLHALYSFDYLQSFLQTDRHHILVGKDKMIVEDIYFGLILDSFTFSPPFNGADFLKQSTLIYSAEKMVMRNIFSKNERPLFSVGPRDSPISLCCTDNKIYLVFEGDSNLYCYGFHRIKCELIIETSIPVPFAPDKIKAFNNHIILWGKNRFSIVNTKSATAYPESPPVPGIIMDIHLNKKEVFCLCPGHIFIYRLEGRKLHPGKSILTGELPRDFFVIDEENRNFDGDLDTRLEWISLGNAREVPNEISPLDRQVGAADPFQKRMEEAYWRDFLYV